MISWLAMIVLFLAGSALAAGQSLIDLDMSVPGQQVDEIVPAKQNRIVGQLPAGVFENSGWQDNLDLRYELLVDDATPLLRITSTRGNSQVGIGLGDAHQRDHYYRLKVKARSPGSSSLNVQMRMDGAPYTLHFSTEMELAPGWREKEWSIRLPRQDKSYSIFLISRAGAKIDLANVQLISQSRDDLIAAIKEQSPSGGELRNRLHVSRFPLGPQSGWGLDRDWSDELFTVTADPTVTGPSGSPALKIVSPPGQPIKVSPSPFDVAWSFQKHTVSFFVRGEGWLVARVFSDASQWDDHGVAGRDVKLTSDWQRVAITFDPVFLGDVHQLRLAVNGTAWVDAMQLVPGEQPGEYASRLPYEVAMALPRSDASISRIQFDDEPAVLDFAVTGRGEARPVLRARVVDIYGQARDLPTIALTDDFPSTGQLRYDGFGGRPLGMFRIEAWVEDPSGKRIGSVNEALVLRIRRPRHWGEDAPRSFFGTHTNSLLRHITLAKAIGVNWTRLHDAGTQYMGWSFLESEKGKWTFFDEDIRRYRDGKLRVLGVLSTTPGWASSVGRPATGYFDRWVRPLDHAQFGEYVDTVVSRYRGVIDDWEIWNEPWGKFWSDWDHQANDNVIPKDAAESFAQLSKVAYARAKQANPQCTIGGINTYGSLVSSWTGDMVRYGAADACDVYTYHQYNSQLTGFPSDSAELDFIASWRPLLDAHGGRIDKPIWFSEGNPHERQTGRGMYVVSAPGKFQDDYIALSDNLARFSIRLLSLGVEKFFYYTMHHHGIFRSGSSAWMACITDDGAPHPSAAAFSAMAWELEDTHFAKTIEVAPGVWAHLFEGDGRSVAAFTSAPRHGTYRLPGGDALEVRDLFGNPLPANAAYSGKTIYASHQGTVAELEKMLTKPRS